jgi:hypothetical protein
MKLLGPKGNKVSETGNHLTRNFVICTKSPNILISRYLGPKIKVVGSLF